MTTKVNATVILDKELYNKAERFANKKKVSTDSLISKAIMQYLEANEE